jgi:hypothetical protein
MRGLPLAALLVADDANSYSWLGYNKTKGLKSGII